MCRSYSWRSWRPWRLYSGFWSAKASPEDRRSRMSKTSRLEQLEQECKERGIRLIYDDLRSEGGLCRLRGCYYVILNRRLAAETRIRIIADALARVREMVEARPAVAEPVSSAPQEAVAETVAAEEPVEVPVPLTTSRPEFEYEEPEVGVPVSAGVPDSQS
jgi:hypothetical protein